MEKKIKNSTDARGLYIQVTSDTVLTTQLKMMTNVGTHSDQRPPWGSSIIYELYKNRLHENTYAVRYAAVFVLLLLFALILHQSLCPT